MLFDDTISRGKAFFFTLKYQPYMFGIIWQNLTFSIYAVSASAN